MYDSPFEQTMLVEEPSRKPSPIVEEMARNRSMRGAALMSIAALSCGIAMIAAWDGGMPGFAMMGVGMLPAAVFAMQAAMASKEHSKAVASSTVIDGKPFISIRADVADSDMHNEECALIDVMKIRSIRKSRTGMLSIEGDDGLVSYMETGWQPKIHNTVSIADPIHANLRLDRRDSSYKIFDIYEPSLEKTIYEAAGKGAVAKAPSRLGKSKRKQDMLYYNARRIECRSRTAYMDYGSGVPSDSERNVAVASRCSDYETYLIDDGGRNFILAVSFTPRGFVHMLIDPSLAEGFSVDEETGLVRILAPYDGDPCIWKHPLSPTGSSCGFSTDLLKEEAQVIYSCELADVYEEDIAELLEQLGCKRIS